MDNLPQGLVSTTAQLPSGLDDTAPIDVDDIVKLWKGMSLVGLCRISSDGGQSTAPIRQCTKAMWDIDWLIFSGEYGATKGSGVPSMVHPWLDSLCASRSTPRRSRQRQARR